MIRRVHLSCIITTYPDVALPLYPVRRSRYLWEGYPRQALSGVGMGQGSHCVGSDDWGLKTRAGTILQVLQEVGPLMGVIMRGAWSEH